MSEYATVWDDDLPGMTHGEEIVRCRDCKWFESVGEECWYFSHWEDRNSHESEEVPAYVEPDGFCAWGERRKVE